MSELVLELDDGYPTEDCLESIENYNILEGGLVKLFNGVLDLWSYPLPYKRMENLGDEGYYVELSTGGWSGNETIIGALQRNHMAWLMSWYSSKRGGHYVFKFKEFPNVTK